MKFAPLRSVSILFILALHQHQTSNAWSAGYEFEGIGARYVSMGGAAIAGADDWSSIYWNPSNIVHATSKHGKQLGIELFAGEANGRDSNSLSSLPGVGAIYSKNRLHSNFLLGAIGLVLPVKDQFALGMGFYTPLLQGADFTDTSIPSALDLENSATILTWTTSLSFKPSPQFSVGAGVNLLYGRLTSDLSLQNAGIANNTLTNDIDGDGMGVEGIFGINVTPTPLLGLGAVYRTGSDVKLEGDANANSSLTPGTDEISDFTYDLRHPATWGLGLSLRPTSKLVFSVDYNQTLWNRFKSNIVYKNPGTLLANRANTFDWRNTSKIRLGIDYTLTTQTNLLLGFSKDESAIDANSIDFATSIDVPMKRTSMGVVHDWSEKISTVLGVVYGSGESTRNRVRYKLSGYQIMLEQQFKFYRVASATQ